MVKTNILTPVLAAVLGVTVVGSGIGYVLVNKDGEEESKQVESKSDVAENISKTLENAEKAVKGELDFAYNSNVKVSFGEAFTKETGETYQSLELSTSTKQKGNSTGADFKLSYGDAKLASLNTVYDREGNNVYAQVPELSDAYLMVNEDNAEQELKDLLLGEGVDIDSFNSDDADTEFDTEAFEKSLEEYGDVIEANLPDAAEGENVKGEISGVEYDYTSKSYKITQDDCVKILTAVLEKAKTDENIKKYYDEYQEMYSSYSSGTDGTSEQTTYEQAIDDAIAELKEDTEEFTIDFISYYDKSGDFAGFDMDVDTDEGMKLITVDTDDACAIDFVFDLGDGDKMTLNGAVKTTGGVSNGSFDFDYVEDGDSAKFTFSVNDLKAVGETFAGSMRIDMTVTEGESYSGWMEIVSKSNDDKMDLSFEVGVDGDSFITVDITGNETEASDTAIPTEGKIYNALDEDELNEYMLGCDTDGFTANLQQALGDELYNSIFGGSEEDYAVQDDYLYYDEDENVQITA